jgi:hypothetical protein
MVMSLTKDALYARCKTDVTFGEQVTNPNLAKMAWISRSDG